jgi:hypothetical protein
MVTELAAFHVLKEERQASDAENQRLMAKVGELCMP